MYAVDSRLKTAFLLLGKSAKKKNKEPTRFGSCGNGIYGGFVCQNSKLW